MAGAEHPNYVMFWASEEQLEMLAASLSSESKEHFPLMGSSTVLVEVT